ncbi:MAG: transcription termination factor NusA [Gemmataceae bacterium]|nr:transcription termination factor NusA [Gemmataceae bacterium]
MNSSELIRIVDAMQRDKNISKDIIFEGIEQAIQLAAERHFGEENDIPVEVSIDRMTGTITAKHGEENIDPGLLGRIAAQSAKQLMIQRIREAECTTVYDKFDKQRGEIARGTVQRVEAGTAILTVDKHEAILPRSEQIPGESFQVGETVKTVVLEVRRAGQRVKVVLSRCHPDFVRCLFEEEIPEIKDRVIEIKAIAREAGHRTKIAVSSIDMKVDCVGACVGIRGSRIKNVIEELNGERIDVIRWNDSLQVMIPNALSPAQIEEVFLYGRLGRAIVLVQEDQLSLAIGRRGQNVRLASKLVGWDIEIMTHDEYNDGIDRAERWFRQLPGITDEAVEQLIVEGFLSYTDLTFLDGPGLQELIGCEEDVAEEMIACAEEWADAADEEARREQQELQAQREAARQQARMTMAGESADAKATFDSMFKDADESATPPAGDETLAEEPAVSEAAEAAVEGEVAPEAVPAEQTPA